ncbi:MAG: hypothetical protein ABUS51_03515 [Acidobacteriota bacterium]
MKPLPQTTELLAVAERVVWFRPPSEALADPIHFLAHVMTYGTVEDLQALDGIAGPDEFEEALNNAPPGIFDKRSWAYWNLKYGRAESPPLPVRRGLGEVSSPRPAHDG